MNSIKDFGANKLQTTVDALFAQTDDIYNQLVIAVKTDKIEGENATSVFNLCAAIKPELRKILSAVTMNGYNPEYRRKVTQLHMGLKTTATFIAGKLN